MQHLVCLLFSGRSVVYDKMNLPSEVPLLSELAQTELFFPGGLSILVWTEELMFSGHSKIDSC